MRCAALVLAASAAACTVERGDTATGACPGTDKVRGIDEQTGELLCGADLAGDLLPGECAGTDKVRGVDPSGEILCGPDADTPVDYAAFGGCQGTDKVRGIDSSTGAVQCEADDAAPAGSIVAFAGQSPPAGWLVCDGLGYQRSAYPALFAAIGTTWGAADGNSFNVPDLRGRFLRGAAGLGGADPDCQSRTASGPGGTTGCGEPGTLQGDALGSHAHDLGLYVNFNFNGCVACGQGWDMARAGSGLGTQATGAAETRPRNAAVEFIIKY